MRHAIRLRSFAAILVASALAAGSAQAENISGKKVMIKDNSDPAKRQVQLQSSDAGVSYSDADAPGTGGAWVHVYSATDDHCVQLPSGSGWTDSGKAWKYKDADKNQAQIADGKLLVKLRNAVAYSLLDDGTQGAVNVQVQFGAAGASYCMKCTSPTKNSGSVYLATGCAPAACDPALDPCGPWATTTTTTTNTTLPPPPGTVRGALTPTTGRFNYNATIGVAGADSACSGSFAGSHACTYAELAAAGTSELTGLKDTANTAVTSLWAIDALRSGFDQCGASIPWDYQTAHTGHKADFVALTNATGVLGSLQSATACGSSRWVACCQ